MSSQPPRAVQRCVRRRSHESYVQLHHPLHQLHTPPHQTMNTLILTQVLLLLLPYAPPANRDLYNSLTPILLYNANCAYCGFIHIVLIYLRANSANLTTLRQLGFVRTVVSLRIQNSQLLSLYHLAHFLGAVFRVQNCQINSTPCTPGWPPGSLTCSNYHRVSWGRVLCPKYHA